MTDELRNYITENVEAFMKVDHCCPEAKDAGQAWLDAKGGPNEDQVAEELVTELQADILPVDAGIKFLQTPEAKSKFGENAPEMLKHFEQLRSEGRLYCDCAACVPVANILSRRIEIANAK